ncbi:MAG: hypothetical protein FWC43_05040 [Planctomycetaceae bacterium]|nr:hypothetical protein [Planctomycetaceae bacterium]
MRVSDLFPTQWGVYVFLFLLGVGCVLGLEYACWMQPDWKAKLGLASLAILDPAQPGNLTAWFSSVLWFLAGLVCLTAFQLDRYTHSRRLSDIWLWAMFGCFLLSVDSTCQVRDFLRDVLIKVSGTALYGNGDVWWISLYLILFGMIGSRLLVEMRHHLLSCNLFFIAALSQILACCIALNLFELPGKEARMPILLRTGLEMLGAFFAVFSIALFVRNMVLQMDFGTKKPIPGPQKKEGKVAQSKAAKKEREKVQDRPGETKREKKEKSKRFDSSRTCPIVFPSQGGEKIVKVEEIEPLGDEETVEKLKKHPKKKPPKPQEEDEFSEVLEEWEELEESDDSAEEEYEEEEYEEYEDEEEYEE